MSPIDLSHTIEHGMITYRGLPAPLICDYLSRKASLDTLSKYNMVFALQFCVTETLVVFHGLVWVIRFARRATPPTWWTAS